MHKYKRNNSSQTNCCFTRTVSKKIGLYFFEGVDLSQCTLIASREVKEELITHYFDGYNIKYV